MEASQLFKSTQHSIPSPDGAYIATADNNRLYIRSPTTLDTRRIISLPSDRNGRYHSIRWSTHSRYSGSAKCILVSDDDTARVWDLEDLKWTATVRNGSGGMGKIVHAEFGRNEDEILLFSEFGAKVTVWSVSTGRSVEIRDPKFSTKGHAYRPSTGLFALLSKPAAQDIVTLHAPNTYFVLKTITLPSTDAQGLKWSPDGRWLVVWDTPSMGAKLFVYSADGHLYRTYAGELNDLVEGLGIKNVEWSPRGDFLAVCGYNERVTLLSTRTFSPAIFLDHTPVIQLQRGDVWQEQVTVSHRSYIIAPQPVSPPTMEPTPADPPTKAGVSIMSFSADGTVVATKEERAPTTVWFWDLNSLTPRTVLIHHAPVKSVSWHPTRPNLLLIQCIQDEPLLYLWDALSFPPQILGIPFSKSSGRLDAHWLNTAADKKPALLLGDAHGCVLVWPNGRDPILRFESPNETDESNDSLYEILTGKKPVPTFEETMILDDDDDNTGDIDDTFMGKGGQ